MPASESRNCQRCKSQFTLEPDDLAFYKRVEVPPPTFCPECRNQRRFAARNERSLYHNVCKLCGAKVISRFSPDKPVTVYCQKCWWSDGWDPKSYGREYDFSKPFFEQFRELLLAVPHVSLFSSNVVNSDWVNQETDDKNCYLNFGGHFNEDSAYNIFELYGKNSFDNYWLLNSELSYECINCEKCYRTLFSENCSDCQDVLFSRDCRNCSDVFGCAGLRNKKYYIFNEPHSKEEYQKFLAENRLTCSNVQKFRRQAEKIWLSMPYRFAAIHKSNNSTGNVLSECKNSINTWLAEKIEDCKHIYIADGVKNTYDGSAFGWSELCYEMGHSMGLYASKFCAYTIVSGGVNSSYLEYCYGTRSSNNCFGCVNMNKGEYCILNKQYSKEDYEALAKKIRRQMDDVPFTDKGGRMYKYGEFFPAETSLYAYNESGAQDYYPLTKEQALSEGYAWKDDGDQTSPQNISDYDVPEDIRDVKEDILEKVLRCEVTGSGYKIIPMELQFYRRMGLPIPRRSPAQRQRDRIARLLPMELFTRTCACRGAGPSGNYRNTGRHFHGDQPCPNDFQTPYAPERPEEVYCEQCYQSEIS